MEKMARDTADRPRSIVGGKTGYFLQVTYDQLKQWDTDEIFSHNMRILLVGYNDRWRA